MGVTAPTAGVVGVPSLASRAVGATIEPVVFIVIAAAFGVIDYYLDAATGGLGVSAFWISFWAMAVWGAWCWPGVLDGRHGREIPGAEGGPFPLRPEVHARDEGGERRA